MSSLSHRAPLITSVSREMGGWNWPCHCLPCSPLISVRAPLTHEGPLFSPTERRAFTPPTDESRRVSKAQGARLNTNAAATTQPLHPPAPVIKGARCVCVVRTPPPNRDWWEEESVWYVMKHNHVMAFRDYCGNSSRKPVHTN